MTTAEIVWSCFKCQEQYACDPSPVSRMLMDRMVSLHEEKCYGPFVPEVKAHDCQGDERYGCEEKDCDTLAKNEAFSKKGGAP